MLLPVLIALYKRYLPIKNASKRFLAPAKNSWVYVFTTRYILHIIVILITLTVTTNNILAQETRVEDFGRGTVIAQAVRSLETADEIVETARGFFVPHSYQNEAAVLAAHVSPTNDVFVASLGSTANHPNGGGAALVKQDVLDTTQAGTPREGVVEYAVQGGDTISTIASSFGISSNTILWANSMSATDYIKPGQRLKIPPVSGVVYTVTSGDTLEKIATKFKAKSDDILSFNQLPAAEAIDVGQQLVIPGGEIEPPKPKPVTTTPSTQLAQSGGPIPSAAISNTKLQWPTGSRKINQYFRYGHAGVDVHTRRSPIWAAESGTVVTAGWGTGYGLHVIIDHGGGMKTLYGHFSSINVRAGDRVSRGQGIGISGCTGWCTGDHLHFEVRINNRATNPLAYF